MNIAFCCTSINPISEMLVSNVNNWQDKGGACYISLDKKAGDARVSSIEYIKVDRAPQSAYEEICPFNSYSRKNITFIEAAKSGVEYLFETDDDNLVDDHALVLENVHALDGNSEPCNAQTNTNLFEEIYATDDRIWARGFPIKWLEDGPKQGGRDANIHPGVVQFLVQGNPDVDAIFRLVKSNDIDLTVKSNALPVTVFSDFHPFNSQATLWPKRYFSLCYLPSTCSIRMTDIWRGYIAQRILYECGEGVKFEKPAVTQVRNEHKIHQDFFDEHLGYLQSETVIQSLQEVSLTSFDIAGMAVELYTDLISKGVFEARELMLLKAYLDEF